ncbi:hypothetical protein A9Q99_16110 [Gammaproteobacteria bacterium 45_16_T64]|nr:hypothetical protein A9Q99_16110 [Gammaproteobacteria bacterium 45_16_T64]
MPWWALLYIALILISLPFGLTVIRRLEQDILHPVGGLLSSLISASFVISYYYPTLLPYQGNHVLIMFAFVLGWDGYSYLRLKERLPELLEQQAASESDSDPSLVAGVLLVLPAYAWGALVCMRAMG